MANNLGITIGTDAAVKTTETDDVHTPHHIVDASALPEGAAREVTLEAVRVAVATLAAAQSDGAVRVDDADAHLLLAGIVSALGGTLTVTTGQAQALTDDQLRVAPVEVAIVSGGGEGSGDLNLAQVDGNPVATGSGNSGAGVLRVTLATDDVPISAQTALLTAIDGHLRLFRPIDGATVAIGGSSAQSGALPAGRIRIKPVGCACHVLVGSSPAATTSHLYIADAETEWFSVEEGDRIAVIQAAGASGGTLYIAAESAI